MSPKHMLGGLSFMADDILNIEVQLDGDAIQVRDESKRELDIRLFGWNEVIQTNNGTEEFVRGQFGVDPSLVRLMGVEHAAQMGIGQDGKPRLVRVPTGKGLSFRDEDDGPHMTFRVSKTAAGDDQLELARDGIVTGASIEFVEVDGGTVTEKRGNRRHRKHSRVDLRGVTTTYQPAYPTAQVLAVRSEEEPVSEQTTPETPAIDLTPLATKADTDAAFQSVLGRLDAMEETARSRYDLPSAPLSDDSANVKPDRGEWMSVVLRMMSGERINQKELEARIQAELITSDNLGVVPEQFLNEFIGIIDPARPFLDSTRKLSIPAAGLTMNVPVLETRPTVAVQAAEKDELQSTITEITSTSFTPLTIGGYGDISLQLLRRSDPSYLSLYTRAAGRGVRHHGRRPWRGCAHRRAGLQLRRRTRPERRAAVRRCMGERGSHLHPPVT